MPSPRHALLLVPVAAAGLAVGGCALGDDGPRTTETRHLAPFTRIDDRSSVDVRLRVGRPQDVRVRAGRKVIGDVETEVHDGTLRIDFDHHGWGGNDVVVEASVPRLTAIETSGSGDIDADGLHADAFEVHSDGSSDVALTGTAGRLTVDLSGSGDADTTGLAAREARVSVDGSGDADVRAQRKLDVRVDGSGDVHYLGNPDLTRQIDGSGDLSRAD